MLSKKNCFQVSYFPNVSSWRWPRFHSILIAAFFGIKWKISLIFTLSIFSTNLPGRRRAIQFFNWESSKCVSKAALAAQFCSVIAHELSLTLNRFALCCVIRWHVLFFLLCAIQYRVQHDSLPSRLLPRVCSSAAAFWWETMLTSSAVFRWFVKMPMWSSIIT